MSVRDKRLANDYEELKNLVANSLGVLEMISKEGNPPYKYVIEYRCRGIEKLQGNEPVFKNNHRVEIALGNNYPREQPAAKFLTPMFHPNVYSDLRICLGSYWTLTETLPELVIRIGKIIQYQSDITNLGSPANSTAKNWAASNNSRFPVDNQTFKVNIEWEDLTNTISFSNF